MSYEIKFNPEGFKGTLAEELRKRLKWAGTRIERNIKRSMPSGGFGKTHTPSPKGSPPAVDTGRLRSSITYSVSDYEHDTPEGENAVPEDGMGPTSGSESKIFLVVGTRTNYAPYLEFGTSKMAARPFLRKGLEDSYSYVQEVFSRR